MSEPSDMDRPVTKRELVEILDERLANYPTKGELERALARYATKDDVQQICSIWALGLERKVDQLSVDLARHVNAILEAVRGQIGVVDDKYKDLPPRVKKLEDKVFAAKRSRRKR